MRSWVEYESSFLGLLSPPTPSVRTMQEPPPQANTRADLDLPVPLRLDLVSLCLKTIPVEELVISLGK